METQPLSQINGEPVRRRRRPDVTPKDGLYRYSPVPPEYRDEDGYLVEDGMGQTDSHQRQTSLWCHALRRRLPAATVCADLFLHYERGDKTKTLAPDLFVALRSPRREDWDSYKLWEHPVPDLVIEMLSDSTSKKDTGSKPHTYAHLGVREYWLFDPKGFELSTPLVGYRLRDGRYRPIAANAAGRLPSEVLGLDLHVCAGELRFRDPTTGEDLSTYDESEDGRAAEQQRADGEKRRADLAELEREAEKHRADREKRRADAAEHGRAAEKRRADGEKRRADAAEHLRATEKQRADAAERELAQLRLRLAEP